MPALDLIALAANIVKEMTANVSIFANPTVPLADFSAAVARLQNGYNTRKNGPEGKAEYDEAYAALSELMRDQADYVDSVAKGNNKTIVMSGFEATKTDRTSATVPDQPNAVKIKTEAGGTIFLSVDRVDGAASYLYIVYSGEAKAIEVTDTHVVLPAGPEYTIIPDGATREEVSGLTPGSKVNVQALAQNAAGKSSLSPLVSSFVL